jgi:hypothetical protein
VRRAERCGELLADAIRVGSVDFGGERDDDRLGLSRGHGLKFSHSAHLSETMTSVSPKMALKGQASPELPWLTD